MNETQLKKLDTTVLGWLDTVHDNVLKRVSQRMQVETKQGHRDLVTNVDRETEQFYVDAMSNLFKLDMLREQACEEKDDYRYAQQ